LLYPASYERITESRPIYVDEGGSWFLVTTNATYLQDDDGTMTVLSIEKERLTGFSSGSVLSEITKIDVNGKTSTITQYIDRTDKKLTEVSDWHDSSLNASNVTINGLRQSESTRSVAVPTLFYYDPLGRQTKVVNSLGAESTTEYDSSTGQVIKTTDFAGNPTTFEYYGSSEPDNAGKLKAQINAAGKKTYFSYTSRGELYRTWGDVPYAEERGYNDYGELVSLNTFRAGSGWTSSSWPGSTGTGDETTWGYQETTGLLTNKTDAANQSVSYSYYTNNLLKAKTWARNTSVTKSYNAYFDLTEMNFSSGNTPDVTYSNFDRQGQPRAINDGTGSHVLEYDELGRMVKDQGTNGSFDNITVEVQYSTNKFEQRDFLKVTAGGSTIQHNYDYDNYGRLQQVADGDYSGNYSYVPNSELISSTEFKTNTTAVMNTAREYEYGFRLRMIDNKVKGKSISSHEYWYDDLNRRRRAHLQDNSFWKYEYNARNELVFAKRYWPDHELVAGQQFEFGYDNIGNRTEAKSGGDSNGQNLITVTNSINQLNQYTTNGVPDKVDVFGLVQSDASITVNGNAATTRKGEYYHYPLAAGNGSGPSYLSISNYATRNTSSDTNSGHVLLPPEKQEMQYDADGNLTNDMIWSYVWDDENRLVEMGSLTAVPDEAKRRLVFGYDHKGRRSSKKVYDWSGSGWNSTPIVDYKFIYDGWNLIAELSGSNNGWIRSYMWGLDLSGTLEEAGGVGGLLMVADHSVTNYHFAGYDGNGNVTRLVKADDESTSAHYEYSPFGEVIRNSGDFAKKNPIRWSSKFWDEESK
jgi:hypothetical protein